MKALLCRAHGLPETLDYADVPDPVPGPGQVVVTMKAAGVNFPDVLMIQGRYQAQPPLPFAPGTELAGIVAAVGPGVDTVRIGDRVIASVGHGAFAEQVLARADRLIPMPASLDFEPAAALLMTYGTCWHALKDRAALVAGETLLVLGAAGGVGLAAVQIGKALGARVIAAASSADKLDVCRRNGADALIDYGREDLRERLKALTAGSGPDVIVDPVGGRFTEPAFRSIGWRGRYLVVGFAEGEIARLPLNLVLLKGAALVGVFWGSYVTREPKRFQADLGMLFELLEAGKLQPWVSARYRLADGARALADMMERRVVGKVVITA